MNQRRQLVIFDTQGKKIAQIGEAFDNFDQLIELVTTRCSGTVCRSDTNPKRKRGTSDSLACASGQCAKPTVAKILKLYHYHSESRRDSAT